MSGPLLPGAVDMGLEALQRGRETNTDFKVWVAPVVWKLAFTGNVERALARECAYVEKSLKIEGAENDPLANRVIASIQACCPATSRPLA